MAGKGGRRNVEKGRERKGEYPYTYKTTSCETLKSKTRATMHDIAQETCLRK